MSVKTTLFVYIISIIIIVCLVFGGIRLIIQSNEIYQKSIEYTERAIKDAELKGKASFTPNYSVIKEGYTESLLYFTLALGVIVLVVLLPRLQNINIGTSGISLSLRELPQKVDDLIKQTNAIQASSAGAGGKGIMSIETESGAATEEVSAQFPDDPQKGKWGGLSERNGRRLSALITPSEKTGYYKVTLTVESTNQNLPLNGVVKFHLHNTFKNPDPIIAVQGNKAVLNLIKVYGAFTVGVEADDGKTLLELDLAELNTAPKKFRER